MNFNSKKVIVTGGASFIGSHLVDSLVGLGAKVTVIDDFSSGRHENLEQSSSKITLVEADLRESSTRELFRNVELVFHLANIHGGRGFIETHPGEIVQNMIIDGNVFRACSEHSVDKVIYTSSACVYPTNLQAEGANINARFLSEEMADPFTLGAALSDGEYGWAKFMGEMQLKAYNKQFGLRGASCRLFTVYGPRENESHAIIAFIAKAMIAQDPFEIWGSGEQDRNFTFVSDIVRGLMLTADRIDDCRPINIGSDEIVKIKDAASVVCKIMEHKPKKFFFDKSKPEGVFQRAASVDLQRKILDWSPTVSFAEGIKQTIDWYKTVKRKDDLENLERLLFERG